MANGTIAFDTLTTSDQVNTGTEKSIDTSYIFNGVAKAWAFKFSDGSGFGDSFNMSSIDDDGTGDYGLNYTNAFNNTSYVPVQSISGGVAAGNSDGHFAEVETANTTSAECENWYGDAGTNATFIDWPVRHTFFGDLA
tara:strand:+ start:343 stop:756 length:414 start_codon:yes stop_codon:yes gene_type:complete